MKHDETGEKVQMKSLITQVSKDPGTFYFILLFLTYFIVNKILDYSSLWRLVLAILLLSALFMSLFLHPAMRRVIITTFKWPSKYGVIALLIFMIVLTKNVNPKLTKLPNFITIASSVVFSPVLEELYFRGYVLNKLLPNDQNLLKTYLALIISSILFAVAHYFRYGMSRETLQTFIMGVSYGFLFIFSERSILAPFVLHVYNNFIVNMA